MIQYFVSTVIYRKYRPSTFAEVIGQDHATAIIREAIHSQNPAHAYLFSGPRGTGKTSMARLVAQAVNCENFSKEKDVCNKCSACMSIVNGVALDIIEMDAASNRGIDEIRSLRDSVHFMPNALNKKVYIIDEAHMLTKDAFNALLKTLEEPPAHVLFVLATTEPHKLPVTILSRVQRHDFSLVPKEALHSKLQKIFKGEDIEVEDGVYDILYTHSHGSFRDAESLVGKILSTSDSQSISTQDVFDMLGLVDDEIIHSFIRSLLEEDQTESLALLHSIGSDSVNVGVFIDQVLEQLRILLVSGHEQSSKILRAIKSFVEAKKNMRFVHDKLLPVQVAVCEVTEIKRQKIQDKIVDLKAQNSPVAPKEGEKKARKQAKDHASTKQAEEHAPTKTEAGKQKASTKNTKPQNVHEIKKFIIESDLPMLVKNQLRGTKMDVADSVLVITCEPEVYAFLTKNGKQELIKNTLMRECEVTEVKIEASEPSQDESMELNHDYGPEEDNSDIVEELL